MSLKKPLGLGLLIGLLAMAFAALPALASAAPQLTDSSGNPIKVGTTITGTSTNAVTVFPGVGTLACEHVEIHGIVESNSSELVKVGMDGESDAAKGCKLGTTTVTIKPTLTLIELTPTQKQAKFDFTGSGLTEESTSTVTYTSGASSIHVAGPVTGSRSGTFSADFALSGPAGVLKVD